MKQKIYQVDAFAERLFSGNPAAVCPLEQWLEDEILQNIAMENNLAETAFYVKQGDKYEIRWFTPGSEVDLCGHATLAAAYVLFNHEGHKSDIIRFHSPRSGKLTVKQTGELLTLDFPSDIYRSVEISPELTACFDIKPIKAFKGKTDYMLIFENEQQIRSLTPHLSEISKIEARGIIATAKGEYVDFVSRFFAPQVAIDEDPVTGSAHTTLAPYWAQRLNKEELSALQLSKRGGSLICRYIGDRVEISGKAQLYLEGYIHYS